MLRLQPVAVRGAAGGRGAGAGGGHPGGLLPQAVQPQEAAERGHQQPQVRSRYFLTGPIIFTCLHCVIFFDYSNILLVLEAKYFLTKLLKYF